MGVSRPQVHRGDPAPRQRGQRPRPLTPSHLPVLPLANVTPGNAPCRHTEGQGGMGPGSDAGGGAGVGGKFSSHKQLSYTHPQGELC